MDAAAPPIKTNLLGLDEKGLIEYFKSMGESAFRARQLLKWIHFFGVTDFQKMSNLKQSLRDWLTLHAEVRAPQVILDKPSTDGTHKWLLKLPDGNVIETVYIPEEGRGTLCISSQVGCMLTCRFCATGKQGFSRNLDSHEIIGQLWAAARALSKENGAHDRHVTNIVMMGMGEPLLNFDPVCQALSIMMDDHAYGLSKRRVTVSTSGIVPAMYDLAERIHVSLAVSLHAPDDELRNHIVPINRKYPLKELMQACQDYAKRDPHKSITFEYVMLDHVNDSPEQAQALVELLADIPSKVNLIPFNPFPGTEYKRSSNNRIHRFQDVLSQAGMIATIRKTRGDDISAACGQLAGEVKDRTSRQRKFKESIQD